MNKKRFSLILFCILGFLSGSVSAAQGRFSGGEFYELPDSFELSFLEMKTELAEASQTGRSLLLFMHMNECAYCARLIKENFHQGDNFAMLQQHFAVIGLNIKGDRHVRWFDDKTYSEKQLAETLKTKYTPTLLFLNSRGNIVYRQTGYRSPQSFAMTLKYIAARAYTGKTLSEFVEQQRVKPIYQLKKHRQFSSVTTLQGIREPLLILVEDQDCMDCVALHENLLNHPQVLKAMQHFKLIRLDGYSEEKITGFDGRAYSSRDWVKKQKLTHRPALLLYNDGIERERLEGEVYLFHFIELLRYVRGRHYEKYNKYVDYLLQRQQQLLQQGIDIDISRHY